jgi:UDP-N-acetylmuramoyl-L-alanyl-D-glutamate--2,6-diaminopimelate ligase
MKIKVEGEKYKFITDDSREINSDGAFFLTSHNQDYKKEVEEKGCAFFLTPQELFQKWGLGKIKIIGITGTNGKTTTSNIIAHILKNFDKKVAVSGTEGVFLHSKNEVKKIAPRTHTTPEILTTLFNLKKALEAGAEFFVMEASSHGISQKRIEGLEFAVKVFTNLSQDHLDFHKTMEEYAKVKSSFFKDESPKVINADDQ